MIRLQPGLRSIGLVSCLLLCTLLVGAGMPTQQTTPGPEAKPPAGIQATSESRTDVKNVLEVHGLIPEQGYLLGIFLLGAYQYLLDWHLKYYMDHDPRKHAKGRQPRIVQVG